MEIKRKAKIAAIALVCISVFGITSCSNSAEDKKLRGQVAGGATGAAVGSLFGSGSGKALAVGAGAVLGTIAGGKIAED
jgi:uncharacterized protein YcfJ